MDPTTQTAEADALTLTTSGGAGLTDHALLRLALGSNAGAASLVTWLSTRGGLQALASATHDCVGQLPGVGRTRARRLLAGIALGRRTLACPPRERPRIAGPADVWSVVGPEMAALPQEHVRALLLDARARLIHVVEVYKGTVSGVNVRLAELFRPAIVAGAVQVVLVHNHPSGDPTPSEADFALTRAASAAGDALGVRVVDHVVVAHGGWASARAG